MADWGHMHVYVPNFDLQGMGLAGGLWGGCKGIARGCKGIARGLQGGCNWDSKEVVIRTARGHSHLQVSSFDL